MSENHSELKVVRRSRDGRRRYDEQAKRALVEACLRPGVSVAGMAQEHGVNANLLRKWITRHLLQRERTTSAAPSAGLVIEQPAGARPSAEGVPKDVTLPPARSGSPEAAKPPAFVPIVRASAASLPSPSASMAAALHVRLPNGIEFDLAEASLEQLSALVQLLGRMPCSASTKG